MNLGAIVFEGIGIGIFLPIPEYMNLQCTDLKAIPRRLNRGDLAEPLVRENVQAVFGNS